MSETKPFHLMWINEHAAPVGGCEGYIRDSALFLKEKGATSTILYQVDGQRETSWLKSFDRAFPQVDLERQIADIRPDLIYIHRLSGTESIETIARCRIPSVRFFHDHKLFCLREHKYTTVGQRVCRQPSGLRCYPCLGFINKSPNWPGIRFKRVSKLLREQRSNRNLDAFVVASKYMADHVAAHGFAPSKIHTIPIFSHPAEVDPTIQREDDLLLFAGQLNRGKGLDTLLQAMAKTKNILRLIVAGSGNQEDEFRVLCETLGIQNRVDFVGKVSSDDLKRFYQKTSCLIFPSRAPETFGLSGTEAMSYGLPVIATDVGGISQWLKDGESGFLFSPSDSDALAVKIDRLFDDRSLYERFCANARERYQNNFRPELHIERLMELFSMLTGKEIYRG